MAPRLLPELRALAARHPKVRLHQRPYQDAGLDGADNLFLATDDVELHRSTSAPPPRRHHLLTNAANTPELCDFYLSAVLQKGDLKITISTNGKSPTIGKRLRGVLAEVLPAELTTLMSHTTLIISRLQVDFTQKVKLLNAVKAELVYDPAYKTPATAYWRRVSTDALITFASFIILNILSYYITPSQAWALVGSSGTFYTFVAVGFVAQMVDGMLGMGYGVVSAISLMSLGLSPVSVSASIHTAEVFASSASGYYHYRFGNVNKRLFRVLLLPGIAGSMSGDFLLVHFGATYTSYIKPVLALYMLFWGLRIITRAFSNALQRRRKIKDAGWLGPATSSTRLAGAAGGRWSRAHSLPTGARRSLPLAP